MTTPESSGDLSPVRVMIVDSTRTFGGAFEQALRLVNALADEPGIDLTLTTAQPLPALSSRSISPDVTLARHSGRAPRHSAVGGSRMRRCLRAGLELFAWEIPAFCETSILLRHLRPDVLHLNNLLDLQQPEVFAAALHRTPILSVHQDFESSSRYTRIAARRVDHHVAISSCVRDNLCDRGIPNDRITVIPNCVDTDEYSPDGRRADLRALGIPAGAIVIALFGRIVEWKGVDVFIDCMAKVLARHPRAWALVVGDESDGDSHYARALMQRAAALPDPHRIVFAGYRPDVPEVMRAVDIVCHLSTRPEPFGLVVIEAMSAARTVISVREGGPLDIVEDGINGLLVTPRDAESAAAAIERVVLDSQLRERLGRAARSTVTERFTAATCAAQYAAIYRAMLDSRRSAAREGNRQS